MTNSEQDRDLSELGPYIRYKDTVVCLVVEDEVGNLSTGTAFHIGNGILATARHVVENRIIREALTGHIAQLSIDSFQILYPTDDSVDLAIIKSNFSLSYYMSDKYKIHGFSNESKVDHIELGTHLDDWIDDGLVLMDVIVLGYPAIPTSSAPVLVATKGEINAIIDPYIGSRHPLFIVSPVARGGFSGGPVITQSGWIIGVVTSSLIRDNSPVESGYLAAVTVEPLYNLLAENSIYPDSCSDFMREIYG